MSVEENKVTLRRVIEEVWNNGDLSVVPELISPDYPLPYPLEGESKGPEGFKKMVTMYRTAIPDCHYTIDEIVGEGDTLVARLSWSGTLTGKLGDTEPTGKSFNITGAIFYRYINGKCAGARTFWNMLSMSQQLGISSPGW